MFFWNSLVFFHDPADVGNLMSGSSAFSKTSLNIMKFTMEYYSAIKKNAFESVLMRWMKMKPIIQSEVSQKEKHQYSTLTHKYGI